MTDSTVDVLRAQANDLAAKNSPLRVLDQIILGLCFVLGWTAGALWRWPASYIAFMALTLRHGYRKANPAKPKAPAQLPAGTPQSQQTVYAAGNTVAYTEP